MRCVLVGGRRRIQVTSSSAKFKFQRKFFSPAKHTEMCVCLPLECPGSTSEVSRIWSQGIKKDGAQFKEKEGGGAGTKTLLESLSLFDFGLKVLSLAPGFI